jgi:phosphoheptose isomerase
MPTAVTARSVMQENREAGALVVQAISSDRESLRGIEGVAEMILQASRKRGRKIKRPTIPGPAANTSVVTSTGNNQGFVPVFATQAEPLARTGDVFTAISANGGSRKILPVRITGALRVKAIAWTGGTGGNVEKRRGRVPLHIVERSDAYPASKPWRDKRFRNSSNGDRSSDAETRYGS